MYRERLEEDSVHRLMWPEPGLLADSPANAAGVGVDATADDPSKAPCAEAVTASGGSLGTDHSEPRNKEEGSGVGVGGKNSDNATTAPASAVASSSSSSSPSALVPRGAYRRLLCVPADLSWEAAAPWEGADGEAGESTATEPSAPCNRITRGSVTPVADGDGGGVGDGGGDRVGRDKPGDPEAQGGAGETEGDEAVGSAPEASSAALPPVWDDARLTFTLPPGSFATMFLREVMKANHDVAWGAAKAAGGNEEGEEGLVVVDAVGAEEI